MKSFQILFAQALADSHLQVKAFAQAVGANDTTISATKSGSRRPPKGDKLISWCDALQLKGNAKASFIRAASLAHCDDITQKHIRSLEVKIKRLQGENIRLRNAQKDLKNNKISSRVHNRKRKID